MMYRRGKFERGFQAKVTGWVNCSLGRLVLGSTLAITLLLSRASITWLTKKRIGRKRSLRKGEGPPWFPRQMFNDILRLPFLVERFRSGSPPSDHTNRKSVREPPKKFEFTLIVMVNIKITMWDS